jgi:hypothetical protein
MSTITTTPTNAQVLFEQGVAASKANDKGQAFQLLWRALQADPQHELAWLWLSGNVASAAQQRFCLERVLALNPQSAAAIRGLAMLPAGAETPFPLRRNAQGRDLCTFPGCDATVSRSGHKFCYTHWRQTSAAAPARSASVQLPIVTLSERLGLSRHQAEAALSGLNWHRADRGGWVATEQGRAKGATQKFDTQTGEPYVLWPEALLTNPALLSVVRELKGEAREAATANRRRNSFRDRFPAKLRTDDGHLVRSRAEVMIDNWLYRANIAHAYERQLPIEEDLYCDFYIPAGKVYIEYWGRESDPKYVERQTAKREIYRRYAFNLIELNDDHIGNLDDHLPKLLLKFNIVVS